MELSSDSLPYCDNETHVYIPCLFYLFNVSAIYVYLLFYYDTCYYISVIKRGYFHVYFSEYTE